MLTLSAFLPATLTTIIACTTILVVVITCYVQSRPKWTRPCPPKKENYDVQQGVVLLFQLERNCTVPSLAAYVLKLETYLRMAEIPYKNDHSFTLSSKGKVPWIIVNGKEVTDSSFCIEYLSQEFDKDLDKGLNEESKAVGRMLTKTMEENTFWATIEQARLYDGLDEWLDLVDVNSSMRSFFKNQGPKIVKEYSWGHGIGRHSSQEIHHIGELDLRSFSVILGSKKYFLADYPTTVDACMFGFLANMLYAVPKSSPCYRLLTTELTNLVDYVERMKAKYWPDWEEITSRAPRGSLGH